jgi:cytochrome c peroxidase
MQGREPTDEQVASLAAFVRSLEPPPKNQMADGTAAAAGHKLFDELGCRTCHPPPSYASPGVFDVGISDENGRRKFNPPSLRGVGQRDRYFHDNRATTLDSAFNKHKHQLKKELSKEQVKALVAFLQSL